MGPASVSLKPIDSLMLNFLQIFFKNNVIHMLITQFTRKFLEIPFCIQTLGDLNMKKKQHVANSH